MQASHSRPLSSLITPPPPAADVDMDALTRADKKPRLEAPQSSAVGWLTMNGLLQMMGEDFARHMEKSHSTCIPRRWDEQGTEQYLITDDMFDFYFKIMPGSYRTMGDIKVSLHSDATSSRGP